MNENDATEIAFKNGYAKGKADCAREIIEDIASLIEKHWSDIKYYWLMNGRSDDIRNLLKTVEKKFTEGKDERKVT